MKRHGSKMSLSITSSAILLMVAVYTTSPLISRGLTQTRAPRSNPGQDGTATPSAIAAATPALASFGRSEELDKSLIESNPTAPDDTLNSTGPYTIPTPLPGGLDHCANGVGTRSAGFGTIRLRSVSPGSVVVRAYLYWGTIIDTPSSQPPPTDIAVFNGFQVVGKLVGSSIPPCWAGDLFVAYRASVIAHINAGINDDYSVTIPSLVTDGSSPWIFPTPGRPLSEGASLVIVYSDPLVQTGSRVYINDGAAEFFATITINNPISPALPPYSILKHSRLGADGQVGTETFGDPARSDERTFLQDTQIRGQGGINLDSDWNGNDGGPMNQLWDTHTDSFETQILTPGVTSYNVQYRANGDCIVAVAHVLGVK